MKKYTREQLLFFIKKLAMELKHSPTIKDMNKRKGTPSSTTYLKRFGTWNKALIASDLRINLKKKFTQEELAHSLGQLSKELARAPTQGDLKNYRWMASSSTYRKAFGSWDKAIRAAGVKKDTTVSLKSFTKKGLN